MNDHGNLCYAIGTAASFGLAVVLSMLANGLSNAEIATALVVSEATVKSHVCQARRLVDDAEPTIPLEVASVASFLLSRIDTTVDGGPGA